MPLWSGNRSEVSPVGERTERCSSEGYYEGLALCILDAVPVPVVLAVAANATTVVDVFVGVAIAVEEATGSGSWF